MNPVKLPFEIVVFESEKILINMIKDPFGNNYHLMIEACGWTEKELLKEELRLIDLRWFPLLN